MAAMNKKTLFSDQDAELQKTFELGLDFVFEVEGIESDDPDDKGGLTRFGIAQNYNPDVDVARLTRDQAELRYLTNYFYPASCEDLPRPIAIAVFDASVNHGSITAVKLLQSALRVKADGLIGPITIAAIESRNQQQLLIDFLSHRALRYHEIAAETPSQTKFIRGWMRRLFKLQHYLNNLSKGVRQ